MLTHRLYARPFALRHASRRCFWCGRETGGLALAVREPGVAWLALGVARLLRH